MNAMVEPLPLVPATWITGGSCRSGWPSAARMRCIRSSERSMRLGCNAVSRATMESMGVMHTRLQSLRPRGPQPAEPESTIRVYMEPRPDHGVPLRAGAALRPRDGRQVLRWALGLGQQPAQIGHRRPQILAMDHHVDHTVLAQILGALEAVRQFLADGLLDDARPGEADERTGLSDVDVTEHRVGGGDAAGGRIGQHDDIGLLRLAQRLHRDRGARELHQRENALLHARAARGREHDEGRSLVHRGLETLDHRLARRHAERAAHEIEILHADHDRQSFELADAELDGVVGAVLAAAVLEPIDVAPLVAEPEGIERDRGDRDIEPGLVVEHRLEPRHRPHAHVIVGAGDDELVRLDVLVEHELPGLRALDPEIFRGLAAREIVADLRPDDVGDPVHACRPSVCCRARAARAYQDIYIHIYGWRARARQPAQAERRRRGLTARPNALSPSKSVGVALVRARSMVSRRSLVVTPPLAEKPPALPPTASTRWHGTMMGNGLRPSACPTSRANSRPPSRAAISPYDNVAPTGMLRAIS